MKLDEVRKWIKIQKQRQRRKYIDLDLAEAGWTIGEDCLTEVPVTGMPNSTGKRLCRLCFIQQ